MKTRIRRLFAAIADRLGLFPDSDAENAYYAWADVRLDELEAIRRRLQAHPMSAGLDPDFDRVMLGITTPEEDAA